MPAPPFLELVCPNFVSGEGVLLVLLRTPLGQVEYRQWVLANRTHQTRFVPTHAECLQLGFAEPGIEEAFQDGSFYLYLTSFYNYQNMPSV